MKQSPNTFYGISPNLFLTLTRLENCNGRRKKNERKIRPSGWWFSTLTEFLILIYAKEKKERGKKEEREGGGRRRRS
jgi:hypothetical protein